MLHFKPRLIIVALALAGAAALPASASAQALPGAFATSTATGGMSYTSTDAASTIRVSLANGTFTIDDAMPIQAKAGCAPFPGDATKVTCTAFKDGLIKFKPFTVTARGGADTVENNTTKTNGVGAPMIASGGNGGDALVGADKVADELRGQDDQDVIRGGNGTIGAVRDELSGGAGVDQLIGGDSADDLSGGPDNDTLDGGDGPDRLNGGGGSDVIDGGLVDTFSGSTGHDTVSYASSSQPVVVDLNRSFPQGAAGENDTILHVEDIEGSGADDSLNGDGNSNRLFALEGDDSLGGNAGVDTLVGGDGADLLFPSPTQLFGVLADGVADSMDCGNIEDSGGDPADAAFRVLADGDSVTGCATVIDN
jgi:Ca2+-binding RTX toxin-like protein